MDRVRKAAGEQLLREDEVEAVQGEIERVVRMFYLQMKVKGMLKPLKEDYFI